ESLVRTLTWILKEHGYEVAVCPGGDGLFAKLEEIKPALLLLDIMMPKVDGLQLLERLKQEERYKDLPVLMVSSMPPEEATVRALNISKCSMVLAKPGEPQGVVVAAYENPMLRNLQVELARYPEIRKAVSTGRLVLVEDVATDPLYEDERRRWEREEIKVPTR